MKQVKRIIEIFKRILPSEVNFKKIYIMAFIYAISEIGILFIFSYFGMDLAFKENSIPLFIVVISSIIVVQLTSNITFAIAFKNGNKVTRLVNMEVREKLFKKAMELDKEYHNNHATGATINTLVGDVEIIGEGFFWPSLWLVINIVTIIVCYLICAIVNFELSLIIVASTPFIFMISQFSFKKMNKVDDKRREARKKRLSHINDGMMGIKTIKTLNLEQSNCKEYDVLCKNEAKWQMRKHYLIQGAWRIIDFIIAIAVSVLFYCSYNEYISLDISYGGIYLFFILFDRCLYSVASFADNFDSFSEVLVSAEKIDKMLSLTPLVQDRHNIDLNPEKLKGKIEFKNMTFKYPKGEQVLTDFNLLVEPKSKVALVGRTGSGKSTIASLIYRFYEPTKGKILFDDKDYLELPQSFIRSNIGFILQDAMLFDDTILNNIRYGKREASLEEVDEVCKKIGLDQFINEMPNKYDTKVGEGGLLLSNGQKQLIAFARVLLKNPDIVILDEATSSIDSKTEQLIQNCINNQFKDKTCIFIAHRLSTIKDVDKIVYLEKGIIAEQGNHSELMDKKGKYYKLYTNQFYNKMLVAEQGLAIEE
jgi:ATP-binding cassette subfamily B protein